MSDKPKSTKHKESAGGVGPWLRPPGAAPHATKQETAEVGGLVLGSGDLEMNVGRPTKSIDVKNTGDRPIQVGSHFHFFETNRALDFDRPATFGLRLDIPAGTAIRFEPGDQKKVTLVPMGGKQRCYGFNDLVNGWTGEGPTPDYRPNFERAVRRAKHEGFKSTKS
ncbi:MAG: urease subunit beta [Paludisphaera borealis]|uniref:urease subunit beta n=1 Tax=Paludisphaera borealis TaxID=1387353 RepID=UPI00285137FA|nr:urease subunit beta [Paludisphaera borealis]MDR3621863.1 urease subunit beta [Paludisphaera borealis]